MLYHLGRLPHIQEKLHQEVDRVVGKEKHITPDKIAKLSYLKAFLKESMRYYFCFYCFCLFFFIISMPCTSFFRKGNPDLHALKSPIAERCRFIRISCPGECEFPLALSPFLSFFCECVSFGLLLYLFLFCSVLERLPSA